MIENDQQVIDYISTKQSADKPGEYTKKIIDDSSTDIKYFIFNVVN